MNATLCTPRRSAARTIRPRAQRRGAVLTVEMLLVLPILAALVLGVFEMSMLWVGNHKLAAASRAGCRVATLPGSNYQDVVDTVRFTLSNQRLAETVEVDVLWGQHPGDPVAVELRAPMRAASPDLLGLLGVTLEGRMFIASTVMRRE